MTPEEAFLARLPRRTLQDRVDYWAWHDEFEKKPGASMVRAYVMVALTPGTSLWYNGRDNEGRESK